MKKPKCKVKTEMCQLYFFEWKKKNERNQTKQKGKVNIPASYDDGCWVVVVFLLCIVDQSIL